MKQPHLGFEGLEPGHSQAVGFLSRLQTVQYTGQDGAGLKSPFLSMLIAVHGLITAPPF